MSEQRENIRSQHLHNTEFDSRMAQRMQKCSDVFCFPKIQSMFSAKAAKTCSGFLENRKHFTSKTFRSSSG